jgi:hypothetical protein
MGKFFNRALLVIAFFTVLFATVHATDINLALGKSATQSSNYNSKHLVPMHLAPSRYIVQNPRVGGNYLNGVSYLNFLNHLPQSNDGHGAEQSL